MAAIILKNPKTHLSRNLIRFFSSSTSDDKLSISSHRQAKSSIRKETDPEKIAQVFIKTTDHPRSYRDRSLFHISVKKLAKQQRFDLVEKILEHQRETELLKTEGFWIRIIMLYSDAKMLDQAIRTFEQMEKSNCERTEKSLCALLSACLQNKRFDLVHEYFDSVPPKTGVVPGVVGHNLVMRAFVAEKKMGLARALLGKMESEKGLKPDVASYNVLLTGYLHNGEDAKFDELCKELINKGLEANLVTYNLRIARLCKNKECVRAKKVIDEMISNGVKPNINSFNTLIDGFCKIADFESAKKIFERMRSGEGESVSPNSDSYNSLIRHLVLEGEFEPALELCKESLGKKWVPPFASMEGLVNGLVKLSKVNEAKEVVENMKTKLRGNAPDAWTKVEGLLPLN